jgi:hypothetical protein
MPKRATTIYFLATVAIGCGMLVLPAKGDDGNLPALPSGGFYLTDVSNPNRNPVVFAAQSHLIYVNHPPAYFGDPATFLTDLGDSDYIHLVDQYVGSSTRHRYTLGRSFNVTYPIPAGNVLTMTDVLNILHDAAKTGGNGYGHIYHVLLPKGIDICFDAVNCYLPDNVPAWTACWFHSSTTFSDSVGHVVFTVLPFQNTDGCDVPPAGTANSQLADSTNNGLTFNLFETITNPDNNAWQGGDDVSEVRGRGIAFICNWQNFGPGGPFDFDFTNFYQVYRAVNLNGHKYSVQPAYSNQIHACAYSAGGDDEQE